MCGQEFVHVDDVDVDHGPAQIKMGADHLALLKYKRKLCPDQLTREEKRRAESLRRLRKMWMPRRIVDVLLGTVKRRH